MAKNIKKPRENQDNNFNKLTIKTIYLNTEPQFTRKGYSFIRNAVIY